MRITNSMMANNILKNLEKNFSNLNKLNEQLSSGKMFKKPSDDPIRVSDGLNYKSQINRNEQYKRNLSQADNWLATTESALNSSTETLQRARELTIYAANDTMTPDDRKALASEFKELRDELVDISETKLGDDYVFSGQNVDQRPFNVVDGENFEVTYQGDNKSISRQINQNSRMDISINAERAFREEIENMNEIYELLQDEDTKGNDLGEYTTKMDDSINKYAEIRSEVGAKMNRVEMTELRLEDEEVHLRSLQSDNEDTDIAKVITELKMQESVYQASLATGSRMMEMSLVDFMR